MAFRKNSKPVMIKTYNFKTGKLEKLLFSPSISKIKFILGSIKHEDVFSGVLEAYIQLSLKTGKRVMIYCPEFIDSISLKAEYTDFTMWQHLIDEQERKKEERELQKKIEARNKNPKRRMRYARSFQKKKLLDMLIYTPDGEVIHDLSGIRALDIKAMLGINVKDINHMIGKVNHLSTEESKNISKGKHDILLLSIYKHEEND